MAYKKLSPNRKVIAPGYKAMAEREVAIAESTPSAKQTKFLKSLIIDICKAGFTREQYLDYAERVCFPCVDRTTGSGFIWSRDSYGYAIDALIRFGKENGLFENIKLKESIGSFREKQKQNHIIEESNKYRNSVNTMRAMYGFKPIEKV